MPRIGPTTDHEEIRQWATARKAIPVEIKPYHFNGDPAIIGFVFSPAVGEQPEFSLITWESFFAQFDLLGLAFAYDEDSPDLYEILHDEIESQSGGAPGVH